MHETVWVDGALAAEKFFDFTGPTGADTVSFTVPNDSAPHQIEANSYSITNGTPITGLPGIVTLTCGSPPRHLPLTSTRRRAHLTPGVHRLRAYATSATADRRTPARAALPPPPSGRRARCCDRPSGVSPTGGFYATTRA